MRCSILSPAVALLVLFSSHISGRAAQSPVAFSEAPVVAKWARFEQSFNSSVSYSNALQDATLTVFFTSPLGDKFQASGFWDGGRTWRVRFRPAQPGRWTYRTSCSDASNDGLHNQKGEFLCGAAMGEGRFREHGLVGVGRDGRHLAHEDGTPFFWLADTAWNGARVSEPSGWNIYAHARIGQQYTVSQWSAASGGDVQGESALTGFSDRVGVNPGFFQRLDEKLERLSIGGMVSAIAPLLDLEAHTRPPSLAEDQAIKYLRYVVARWDADPVVWVIAFDGKNAAEKARRWVRIGRAVFGEGRHRPVLVYAGGEPVALEVFRDEPWVGIFGFDANAAGQVSKLALGKTTRPFIAVTPFENGLIPGSRKRFTTTEVRQAACWGLVAGGAAGVSYGGNGVVNWDTRVSPQPGETVAANLPLWEKALFMPAARQLGNVADMLNSSEFWRLTPQSQLTGELPDRRIACLRTEAKDLALVYVQGDRSVELPADFLPTSAKANWFNPRTGETSSASPVTGERTVKFNTPDTAEWLLVLKAGR